MRVYGTIFNFLFGVLFLAAILLSSFDLGLSTNNPLITGPLIGLKKTKDDYISGHIIGEDKNCREI